jgi:hypothetical protein
MLTQRRICGLILFGLVAAGLAVWLRLQPTQIAARTIPTGASFSVSVTQSPSDERARAIAGRIAASGLPAFTRSLPARRSAQREGWRNGAWYQVIVGPYASLDEAEAAQRLLARQGFRAQILVDESVRRVAGHDGGPRVSAGANVLLIAGAGRVAVVIELPVEPRRVVTRPVGERVLEIEAGPIPAVIGFQRWNAPAGVALLQRVSVDQAGTGEGRSIRARIAMSEPARGSVRTAGRRLYIDLSPRETQPELASGPALRQAGREGPLHGAPKVQDYRATIGPAVAKFDAIEPFVLSAVGSPTPDVLSALERTLRALDEWMRTVRPPRQWQDTHDSLVSAIGLAAEAASPEFTGDRTARAREAFALRDTARVMLDYQLPTTNKPTTN